MSETTDKNLTFCEHEWEFMDDSFSHEFGTKVIHYYQCKLCGDTCDVDEDDDC